MCRLDLSRVKPGLPDCAILDVMTIDMSFLSRWGTFLLTVLQDATMTGPYCDAPISWLYHP